MQKTINDYLKVWGLNPHGGPLVRLIWSDDSRELRRGTFNEFYRGIFLREFTGVKSCLKYEWIKERWVLERWFPPDITFNLELPESKNGSYEPIYIFQDKFGNALSPNVRVVELICQAMFNQPPTHCEIHAALEDDLDRKDKKETTDLEDGLEMSVISTQLHQREAIIVPKEYEND